MTAQPQAVPDVECSDCGKLVPPPPGVSGVIYWRCYACGWGSASNVDTE